MRMLSRLLVSEREVIRIVISVWFDLARFNEEWDRQWQLAARDVKFPQIMVCIVASGIERERFLKFDLGRFQLVQADEVGRKIGSRCRRIWVQMNCLLQMLRGTRFFTLRGINHAE